MKKKILGLSFVICFVVFALVSNVFASPKAEIASTTIEVGFWERFFQWFFHRNDSLPVDVKTGTSTLPVSVKPKPVESSLVSYSDPRFKARISYPKEMNIAFNSKRYCNGRIDCDNTNSEAIYIFNYPELKSDYDSLRKELSKNEFLITMSISRSDEEVSLDSLIPGHNEAYNTPVVSQKIIFNGFDATVIRNEWGYPAIYYLVNGKEVVKINVKYKDVDELTKKKIDGILSSFTFAE